MKYLFIIFLIGCTKGPINTLPDTRNCYLEDWELVGNGPFGYKITEEWRCHYKGN